MLLTNKEVESRLNSPLNLMNRLRSRSDSRTNAMSLFIPPKINKQEDRISKEKLFNPFEDIKITKSIKNNINITEVNTAAPPSEQDQNTASLSNLIENHESQVQLGLAHDTALKLLNNSVTMLADKLDDIRADKLPGVVTAASKVVESIRRERSESSKNSKDKEVHYHFYTPQQRQISEYEVIDV